MKAMGLGVVSLVTLVFVGSSWSGASQAQAPAAQQASQLRIQVTTTQLKPTWSRYGRTWSGTS